MESFRKIKTQEKYERRKWDLKTVPQILLKGEWLKAAGFEAGTNCSVKVENGRLTILSL
jgi:hypothetical protein